MRRGHKFPAEVMNRTDAVILAMAAIIALLYLLRAGQRFGKFFRSWRALKRRWRDECPGCGYNLQGNTSGICPECGRKTTRM
jgi:hypothetical protein